MIEPNLKLWDGSDSVVRANIPGVDVQTSLRGADLTSAYVVSIDGGRARSWSALYAQIESEFRLPGYFGENLDALEEVLCDIEYIQNEVTLMIINGSEHLLEEEGGQAFMRFIDTVESIGKYWDEERDFPRWFGSLLQFDSIIPRYALRVATVS